MSYKGPRVEGYVLLVLQPQFLHDPLLLRDLLHREVMIIGAVQVEWLVVELRYCPDEGWVFHAFLERIVQDLDDVRVHPFGTGDAIEGVHDHVDADFL